MLALIYRVFGLFARLAPCAGIVFFPALMACHFRPTAGMIPAPTSHAWVPVFSMQGFRILADTEHVQRVPTENALLVTFVTLHDEARHTDSITFNRSRIRLLIRCAPVAFRSVSQDLALNDGPVVSHTEWRWLGSDAQEWHMPQSGATDDEFLRRTCAMLLGRGAEVG